jgi:hypothetical protein
MRHLLLLAAASLAFGASCSVASAQTPTNILVVGDSLEVGTAPNLGALLPGATITSDAVESRSSSDVLAALSENIDGGFDAVVFDAGTNDDPANPGLHPVGRAALARLDLGVLDASGPGRRILRHVNGAAADYRPAAGASAEFCQSHPYRQIAHPVSGCSYTGLMSVTNPAAASS